MGSVVTAVTFEPDWCAVYIDGELYDDGHEYDRFKMTKVAVNDTTLAVEGIETRYYNPEQSWKGTPETLDEVEEIYG